MPKAHSINSKGTTEKYADALAKLRSPGDYVLVVRGVPRTIVMICPDDCGETLTVNLDRRVGKAWRRYEGEGRLTIYPSVWRDTGCRAHFIVWNDRVLWCDRSGSRNMPVDNAYVDYVFRHLSDAVYQHVELIADLLQASPWEVLWACRDLVHRGRAQEGEKGTYRKIGDTRRCQKVSGHIDIVT